MTSKYWDQMESRASANFYAEGLANDLGLAGPPGSPEYRRLLENRLASLHELRSHDGK
jgi:hypothetical protein